MKVFVVGAVGFDSCGEFAVFSARADAEACKVRIENAVKGDDRLLVCIAERRSCISCPGREDCVEWERKWDCDVYVRELELDDCNANPSDGFLN